MAHIIGEAARYTTARSIKIFQRMLLTTMMLVAGIGIFEGAVFTEIILRWRHSNWPFLGLVGLGAVGIFFICRSQSARIDQYERDWKNWRKGAEGERIVASILESLSDEYWIINDINTRAGNLDHVVIGPTGVYAVETKNCRGIITADESAELLLNGKATAKRHVKALINRIMSVRETVLRLTRVDDLFIKGLMVFPKARVDARFGQTSTVNCLTEASLCSHIEDSKPARKLSKDEIEKFVRAFEGIARMEIGFAAPAGAGVKQTRKDQNLSARPAATPYQ